MAGRDNHCTRTGLKIRLSGVGGFMNCRFTDTAKKKLLPLVLLLLHRALFQLTTCVLMCQLKYIREMSYDWNTCDMEE